MTDAEVLALGKWLMRQAEQAEKLRTALMKDGGADFELRIGRWALEESGANPTVAAWVREFQASGRAS